MSPTVESAPETIGEYEIEHELGRGAFGTVYRAYHRDRPETPIALKVVRGQGNVDRMMLEPAVLSRLHHPCIVGLEDYFLRGDDLVLALEFIDGRDVKSLLDDEVRFLQPEIRDLLLQIGSALAAAHEQNVVHRDIKPANILVQRRDGGGWRFVLTDFGIGQVREGIATQKQTGGTYLFMAPEQLRGRPCAQSDLWALGVVAYRLLTGRMPFPGPTVKELTNQILYGGVTPPSEICKEPVDPQLEKAILHLLDKSLQERTATAEEMLRDLGHRGSAIKVPLQKRGAKKVTAGTSLDKKLTARIRSRRVWLVLAVLTYMLPTGLFGGLLLLAGMIVFYVAQRGGLSRWRCFWLTCLSILVLAGSVAFRYLFPKYDYNISHAWHLLEWLANWLTAWGVGVLAILVGFAAPVAWVFLPVIAGALFASVRRLQREQLLRDLARQEGAGSDRYLAALQQALDTRFEDVGLHLKYAEALFARDCIPEAAVEARILLRQDPYNFNGNLLLANAYYALHLDRECVDVCDRYLEVSGYCFEFSELRDLARRRLGE